MMQVFGTCSNKPVYCPDLDIIALPTNKLYFIFHDRSHYFQDLFLQFTGIYSQTCFKLASQRLQFLESLSQFLKLIHDFYQKKMASNLTGKIMYFCCSINLIMFLTHYSLETLSPTSPDVYAKSSQLKQLLFVQLGCMQVGL